ncbi:hypothetical protein EVAR_55107_1 [Eumeta japonica]|uniref:Uncharacterized protein n=1 Tax=Eumeta variegata TaxID=151549 RepID=A0A4C1YKA3_EUMVA|nr:hypothetical protein EVAR_55107_1 [Eumeta japonica]
MPGDGSQEARVTPPGGGCNPSIAIGKRSNSSEKNYGTSVEVTSYRSNAVSHMSLPHHSILRAPLRCQGATACRGIRRPSDEAKRWWRYLNHDACMRSALHLMSAAGAETIEYN